MKKRFGNFLLLSLVVLFVSCKKDSTDFYKTYTYEFKTDTEGWKPLFADYPVGEEEFYELQFKHTHLPAPLDQSVKAIQVTGNNHSDDLLMMMCKKVDGLKPNATYGVTFSIDLASNVRKGSPGAGGSPDLSLGAGALSYEPKVEVKQTSGKDYYRPNFNSVLQGGNSSEHIKVLGQIGVTDTTTVYTFINRNNANNPFSVTTNHKGELWLLLGLDSGFEGITSLYYKRVQVRLYE
ncbi:MAG: hypothetical protein ICV66_13560 [Chitinophagaceae bacterium]|nr:hypothetical protein [Chitinophagaceae bacterium]